jgi:amino acid transporter
MAYIPVFPAWLKLRKTDPDRERPYKVPGSTTLNKLFAFVPAAILCITVILCLFPVYENEEGVLELVFDEAAIATIAGVALAIISGEILARVLANKQSYAPVEIEE